MACMAVSQNTRYLQKIEYTVANNHYFYGEKNKKKKTLSPYGTVNSVIAVGKLSTK